MKHTPLLLLPALWMAGPVLAAVNLATPVATAWAPGSTLWLRWVENNDVGNDHGLGIENLSLSVTSAVPEPTAQALLLAGLLGLGLGLALRRRA